MGQYLHNPGTDNLPEGKYYEVGPRGGKLDEEHAITIDQGDRLPPTQVPGHKWVSELLNPGKDNQPAGTYLEVGPRGGKVHDEREITIDQGDRLPPTQGKNHKWIRIK